MKSLIPVLLTVSLTLTMKGYISSPDFTADDHAKPISIQLPDTVAVLAAKDTITSKLKKCDWELVKTAVVPVDRGLNLSSPRFLSDYPVGDVSWISNEGTASQVAPANVRFLQLSVNDIRRFNWEGFNTTTSTAYPTAAVLQTNILLPGQIPSQAVVAYQTEDGNYYLLKIKTVTWGTSKAVELSVYHAV